MGEFTKGIVIGMGALLGGSIALYWREKFTVKKLEAERTNLDKELKELIQKREEKERQVKNLN